MSILFKKKSIDETSAGLVEEALKGDVASNSGTPEKVKESEVSEATITESTSNASNEATGVAADGK